MTSPWTHINTPAEIAASHELTASIDPAFAARDRAFWESRTLGDLLALEHQAWLTNNPTSFQMARSYAAAAQEGHPHG